MNHFPQIASKLDEYHLDALLLTAEANRFYASGYHSAGTDGVALAARDRAWYFTDARYIEAAERAVRGAEVSLARPGRGYVTLLNEAMEAHGLRRVGFEDACMTVADYNLYQEKLR